MTKDIIEYAEATGAKTLDTLRKSYDDKHEKVYKLASILAAAAGAMGAYALDKAAGGSLFAQWVGIAALSVSWFAIVGYVVVMGATSQQVSPGNSPGNILKYFHARLAEQPNFDRAAAFEITRQAELDLVQKRISAYIDANDQRAKALDVAYKATALSPLVPIVATIILSRYS